METKFKNDREELKKQKEDMEKKIKKQDQIMAKLAVQSKLLADQCDSLDETGHYQTSWHRSFAVAKGASSALAFWTFHYISKSFRDFWRFSGRSIRKLRGGITFISPRHLSFAEPRSYTIPKVSRYAPRLKVRLSFTGPIQFVAVTDIMCVQAACCVDVQCPISLQ